MSSLMLWFNKSRSRRDTEFFFPLQEISGQKEVKKLCTQTVAENKAKWREKRGLTGLEEREKYA